MRLSKWKSLKREVPGKFKRMAEVGYRCQKRLNNMKKSMEEGTFKLLELSDAKREIDRMISLYIQYTYPRIEDEEKAEELKKEIKNFTFKTYKEFQRSGNMLKKATKFLSLFSSFLKAKVYDTLKETSNWCDAKYEDKFIEIAQNKVGIYPPSEVKEREGEGE